MDQRLSLITLGVPDQAEARRFYLEAFGWTPVMDAPGQITFIQVAPSVLLALFGADELAADVGTGRAAPAVQNVTLSHNVGSPAEVDAIMAEVAQAGATILKEPQQADWGGYHGYFADPAGTPWEVAYVPGWAVAEDGTVTMGPAD